MLKNHLNNHNQNNAVLENLIETNQYKNEDIIKQNKRDKIALKKVIII